MKLNNILKTTLAAIFLIYACFYLSKKPVTSEELFKVNYSNSAKWNLSRIRLAEAKSSLISAQQDHRTYQSLMQQALAMPPPLTNWAPKSPQQDIKAANKRLRAGAVHSRDVVNGASARHDYKSFISAANQSAKLKYKCIKCDK